MEEFDDDSVEVVSDVSSFLSRRKDPFSFWLLLVCAQCVLLLGLRGYGPLAVASLVVLVWTATRYIVVRLSIAVGTHNRTKSQYRPLVLAPVLKSRVEDALRWVHAVVEWRDSQQSLKGLGGAAVLGVVLFWTNLTVAIYVCSMLVLLRANWGDAGAEK